MLTFIQGQFVCLILESIIIQLQLDPARQTVETRIKAGTVPVIAQQTRPFLRQEVQVT